MKGVSHRDTICGKVICRKSGKIIFDYYAENHCNDFTPRQTILVANNPRGSFFYNQMFKNEPKKDFQFVKVSWYQ